MSEVEGPIFRWIKRERATIFSVVLFVLSVLGISAGAITLYSIYSSHCP